jgi:hypothetical protein
MCDLFLRRALEKFMMQLSNVTLLFLMVGCTIGRIQASALENMLLNIEASVEVLTTTVRFR